jgi:excisionase family DNA binding protein
VRSSVEDRRRRLLTVDEAAEVANVGERYIRRLVAERRIPFYKLGRKVRIDANDLTRFIEAGRIGAAHPESRHIFGNGR